MAMLLLMMRMLLMCVDGVAVDVGIDDAVVEYAGGVDEVCG